jgi:hypothetical protein
MPNNNAINLRSPANLMDHWSPTLIKPSKPRSFHICVPTFPRMPFSAKKAPLSVTKTSLAMNFCGLLTRLMALRHLLAA